MRCLQTYSKEVDHVSKLAWQGPDGKTAAVFSHQLSTFKFSTVSLTSSMRRAWCARRHSKKPSKSMATTSLTYFLSWPSAHWTLSAVISIIFETAKFGNCLNSIFLFSQKKLRWGGKLGARQKRRFTLKICTGNVYLSATLTFGAS